MRAAIRLSVAAAFAVGVGLPRVADAQAFTPPPQVGSFTVSWQWVSNTGHFATDGTLFPLGESVTTSALIEADYGVTERFAVTAGLPYVFAKYTGGLPPFSNLERDSCQCWHSSVQDISVGGRYRFGDEFWAITPAVKYGAPTHNYPFEGEAVVGPHLKQLLMGINAGLRLTRLPRASVQGGYSYSISEQPIEGLSNNHSSGFFNVGYGITRSLFAHGGATWQRSHSGIITADVFSRPDLYAQRDRILGSKYWHVVGGASYSTSVGDLFFAVEKYVWGQDTHNGIAYTAGSTFYFDLSRKKP